jgi:hypothetical protein
MPHKSGPPRWKRLAVKVERKPDTDATLYRFRLGGPLARAMTIFFLGNEVLETEHRVPALRWRVGPG